MYSAKGGQIMRLKYVPIYSQHKNNIFWILKTAISKNDMELTGTCGMSVDDMETEFDEDAERIWEDALKSPKIKGLTECPVSIHAYDSQGKHAGVNATGGIDLEIPGTYYTGPDSESERIVILGQSEDIIFQIEALDMGEFDFTLTKSTGTKTTTITYMDVPIIETTIAMVDMIGENPNYTMEIDDNGDGTVDNTTDPTHITINHAPNISITTPIEDQCGNVTLSYNLKDAESDNCTIMAQYSLNNITWLDATMGEGGDGVTNVTTTSGGVDHTYVWASDRDIRNTNSTVYFKVRPFDDGLGDYATTGAFSVDNRVRGDLNSDGSLTPADAAIALELAASGGWDAAADVNHDSRIHVCSVKQPSPPLTVPV